MQNGLFHKKRLICIYFQALNLVSACLKPAGLIDLNLQTPYKPQNFTSNQLENALECSPKTHMNGGEIFKSLENLFMVIWNVSIAFPGQTTYDDSSKLFCKN